MEYSAGKGVPETSETPLKPPVRAPGGEGIELCNNSLNWGVWLTGLMVDNRTHPCEAMFTTKKSSFAYIACLYHEYVANIH